MKTKLTLLALLAFGCAYAQQPTEKEMMKHMKEVQKSRDKQSVIWDMDTVFVSGAPYCVITEKDNGFLQPHDFIVKSLQGTELIYVKYNIYTKPSTTVVNNTPQTTTTNVAYYSWLFEDTQQKSEISYPNKVYKWVVEYNLINGNQINSAAETKFISLNGTQFSQDAAHSVAVQQQVNNAAPNGTGVMVDRNRTAGIMILDGTVTQDSHVIGTVKITQDAVNGTIVKTMTVWLPNGAMIAQGKAYGATSNSWTVVTMKDNQSRAITSSVNEDAMDVVKFLINSYYL
jgi:hypothetical protein